MSEQRIHERFCGVRRLHGERGAQGIRAARFVVIGLGGVGSWASEALVRSGAEHVLLVDPDTVAESNANRQLQALDGAFGRAKATVLLERLERINPQAHIEVLLERIDEKNVSRIISPQVLVLECVDDVPAKAAIVRESIFQGAWLVVSGGAGGRLDPTRIRLADLAQVTGDPLLSNLRRTLRKKYGFAPVIKGRSSPFGVQAAFSDEAMRHSEGGSFGAFMPVTATMGMALASAAIVEAIRRVNFQSGEALPTAMKVAGCCAEIP